jgi:hypothetical protein
MLSPSSSSAGYPTRLVLAGAVLFSLIVWGALVLAIVDLI